MGVELGRCYCRYPVEIDIAANGTLNILTTLPQFTLTPNASTLHGTFAGGNDTTTTWDFGDGSALVQGNDVQTVTAGLDGTRFSHGYVHTK
jgi:hypothetical protein